MLQDLGNKNDADILKEMEAKLLPPYPLGYKPKEPQEFISKSPALPAEISQALEQIEKHANEMAEALERTADYSLSLAQAAHDDSVALAALIRMKASEQAKKEHDRIICEKDAADKIRSALDGFDSKHGGKAMKT